MINLFKGISKLFTPAPKNSAEFESIYNGHDQLRTDLFKANGMAMAKYCRLYNLNKSKDHPPFYFIHLDILLNAALELNQLLSQREALLCSLQLYKTADNLMDLLLSDTRLPAPSRSHLTYLSDEFKKWRNAS
ncbi:MAG: hypothetical protein CMK63_00180 [Pseudoalteromonadaceae bacterium]|nr:hypothetical protein [Pseudoalteromonadaceae bacterium]